MNKNKILGRLQVRGKGSEKKLSAGHFYILAALFFFLIYWAIWPIVWHGVILPHTQSNRHQFRLESYFPNRIIDTTFYLDNPDSTLTAYAVWQIPKEGLYHLKLTCDDNGEIKIDNRSIMALRGINALNKGEAKLWLSPGPHFLELHLRNVYEKGWLKIEVAEPGQTHYALLIANQLSYPDLGNIETCLDIVSWGKFFAILGIITSVLGGVRFFFHRLTDRIILNNSKKFSKTSQKLKPRYFLFGLGLFLFLLHFALWPLAWHGIILPKAHWDQHRFRLESNSPAREAGTSFYLENADSSLSAYSIWQIPRGGLYQLKLSCDGDGKVLIDNRPVIVTKGVDSLNIEEATTWLTPGPHLLELRLNNNLNPGWLKIAVAQPGQVDGFGPMDINELHYLDFNQTRTWITIISLCEHLCFLGFIVLLIFWLGNIYFRRWAGSIFPDRRWGNFFWKLTLFSLTLSVVYFTKHPIPPIYGDGLGYYAYLPSYLIYHDTNFESIFQSLRFYDYHCGGELVRYPGTG
ncbi:MAG TPA: hypothetical protein VK564_08065, partial [Thermodesulfobacteriota bacterium]|nr:hypothetical protein [Thermodesulfobacteriota bacterium]